MVKDFKAICKTEIHMTDALTNRAQYFVHEVGTVMCLPDPFRQ